ncbi:TauD/TfdA family dioxygenase [Photobacterium arenosum]|uniref:TauD/TfdA family dioxygenase n=1 Tax=Photobacterium arenosum TaxID=2774143 RepID=UPI002889BCDB|nr:TauD/TfdA family dioxygenase [Photobacterium arenosum]
MSINSFIDNESGIKGYSYNSHNKDNDQANTIIKLWIEANREEVLSDLHHFPALIFRNFPISSPDLFEDFVRLLNFKPYSDYTDLPKESNSSGVYKSTPYPNHKPILFHNESAHMPSWPQYQFFHCLKVAEKGGATPIVDCRKVLNELPAKLVDKFTIKKLAYVRTFKDYLDVSWQSFFMTSDKDEASRRCIEQGYNFKWLDNGELQISTISPGTITHPITQENVFFNQVQLHHVSFLDTKTRDSMEEMFGSDMMPRNVFYGDGSVICDYDMNLVKQAFDKYAVRFKWRRNDILMLDNMLTAHGRDPFEGDRKISVIMANMVKKNDFLS